MASFDYETTATTSITATIEEDGRALVSSRLLAEIVKALPNKPVTLHLDGQVIHVRCGASKFRLLTMPVDDFPALPASGAPIGTVPAAALEHAIAQVATAASRDDTLPLLTGVRVEATPGLLTFLSTDRYRLALRELAWTGTVTENFLIRAKTLTDAAKTLHGEVSVSRHSGNGVVALSDRDRTTTSLLIDGDYPNVRRLFPDETPTTATVNVADLIGAVKRVALVAERSTPVRLVFTEGDLTVETGQGDDATASETLPAALTGDEITVAFSPRSSSTASRPSAPRTSSSASRTRTSPSSSPGATPTASSSRRSATSSSPSASQVRALWTRADDEAVRRRPILG